MTVANAEVGGWTFGSVVCRASLGVCGLGVRADARASLRL